MPITTPEEYTLHLCKAASATLTLMMQVEPRLDHAVRYLGATHTTNALIAAAKVECMGSFINYMSAVGGEAQCWVVSGAVDRMFGAVVAMADETKKRMDSMKTTKENA